MKRLLSYILTAALLTLCAAGDALAQARAQVGMMEVDGKNAFHNQQRVKHRSIVPIYDGDYVSTGARTSVRIGLTADGYGGFIQLDENTDPNLILATKCIVMKMLKGQALVNAKNICLGTQSISGVTRSLVNLKADGAGSELTVVTGSVDLEQPTLAAVGSYQRYHVGPDGRINRYAIDAAEANRTIAWSQDYFGGKGSGKGKKTAGIIAAIAAAILIGKEIDDRNDRKDRVDSPPLPWCCNYDMTPSVYQSADCAAQGGSVHPTKDLADDQCISD